jgi:vanillate O-demethylase monooxygenase subunit
MGDAAAADEGLIPPLIGLDHPDYVLGHSQLDYAAQARLVNDNLLDLSHASFLHTESFRASPTWALMRPKVTECDRSVRIEWWIKDEPPMGNPESTERVDTYLCYDFFVPGTMLMSARVYPVGTADSVNGQPDLAQPEASITSQAITPMTDKTTRYFYSMGAHRHYEQEGLIDAVMAVTKRGFTEDKAMIEAQQRVIDMTPEWRFMPTTADRGVVTFNRLIEKLVHQEAATASGTSQALPPSR